MQFLQIGNNFSILQGIQTGSETHAAPYSVGTQSSFPSCKATRHDADHSLLSSTEVKHELMCTSTPPVCLYGVHSDKFTVT
jgi:hypothetical protein